MATFITNADGTVSVRHSPDEIADAARKNAGTERARAEQIEVDLAKARALTAARLAAATPSDHGSGGEPDATTDAAS